MMSRLRQYIIVIILFCIGANCSGALIVNIQPHPNHERLYYAYYRPASKLLNEYGSGANQLYQAVKGADALKVKSVWNEKYGEAVSNYMYLNNRIPPECKHGIVLVSSSPDEGGGATTVFGCK